MLLLTCTFVTTLYAMAVTIASIALPDMRGAMAATQDQITWTITGNIVATAVATPLAGWLAGHIQPRVILLFSVTGFIGTSILCGLSQSLEQIVIFRVLQGIFGAPLVPLPQALVLTFFPPEKRSMAMSVYGMGVILGPIIAPTLGGYLGEEFGWRWIFFTLVPFGLSALILVYLVVPKSLPRVARGFDVIGFLALATAVASFQLLFDRGERNSWFDSIETWIEISLGFMGLYIFIVHSLTTSKPFVDLRIFADRNYALGLFLVFVFGMLNFAPMVLFPPLMQELRGYPSSVIGILMGARGVGTFLGFMIMAFAGRLDPRIPLFIGFVLQGVAGWEMSQFSINMTTFDVFWTSALQGLGVGLCWVPIAVVTFSTLNNQFLSEGTALFHLVRNFASSLYISVSVAVVLRMGAFNYTDIVNRIDITGPGFMHQQGLYQWGSNTVVGTMGLSREIYRQSMMIGYIDSFFLFSMISFAALLGLFFIKPKKS
ncbi:MAG: DHA2 family efflux MFS transporter permease subunit [Alphaproteobacteria bacterium]|nr:DHA2 family efflux MFS transporter permease subunit [Alphaproteobacteria bacterium]